MECEKYKELLQLYHDNELEKGREANLFTHLSECSDCREYFRTINLVSSNIQEEEFPHELDERILYSVKEKGDKKQKGFFKIQLFPVFSYAAVVVLLIIGIFFYMKSNQYKDEIILANRQIKDQNKTIELLYNSLPAAEVSTKFNQTKDVIIKANL